MVKRTINTRYDGYTDVRGIPMCELRLCLIQANLNPCAVTLFWNRSPVWGTNYLEIDCCVPETGLRS